LRNTGNVPVEYGNAYTLELDVEGKWIELAQPTGAEIVCVHTGEAYLMDPGSTRPQEISLCDFYGETHPLAPGEYRLTKTVRTIPATPGAEAEEIAAVVMFEVTAPTGPVPAPSACRVLCMSETGVQAGDAVRVTFDPPRRFVWGARSELHLGSAKTATAIAHLVGWQHRDKELTTFFAGEGGGVEDIGFAGRGSWRWKVPARLEPGIYALAKDGIRGSPGSAPMRERRRFWSVAFEVSS
jgi:hypothetical protein